MSKVRVRYAPSPTGLLHIGNARTALFNYLFAKHHCGDFIIRIEDTDVLRNVVGGEESQLKYLSWLGITWDESPDKGGSYGPYRQLERLDLYKKYALILLEAGLAYKEFREGSNDYAIRFKVPKDKVYRFVDMVRGELTFLSKEVEDWVIVKENGIPTYNFAVVIDDHLMEISHVLRGEEHITNTPKQLMIYEAFNWVAPIFGHMTIIVNEEKKKLSKRDASVMQFISQYESLGYLPDAMFNFISLLGFSPSVNEEIFTPKEIIALFDEARLAKAPSYFDRSKLAYINSMHIKKLSLDELVCLCARFLGEKGIALESKEWLLSFVELFRDRLVYLEQIVDLYKEFFSEEQELKAEDFNFLVENKSLKVLEEFLLNIQDKDFNVDVLKAAIKETGEKSGVKGKLLFMPLRIAITKEVHGPSLESLLVLLGKKVVINRLNGMIDNLRRDL